eukprot:jgi/Psemu1/307918/fgenesh1_kg.363_\
MFGFVHSTETHSHALGTQQRKAFSLFYAMEANLIPKQFSFRKYQLLHCFDHNSSASNASSWNAIMTRLRYALLTMHRTHHHCQERKYQELHIGIARTEVFVPYSHSYGTRAPNSGALLGLPPTVDL